MAVASGWVHGLGLRSDGTLVAWGNNSGGQCDVPTPPLGVSYVQAAGGEFHSVAVRSDGMAVAWGYNPFGQCDVPALPPGVTYVEVAAGEDHSLALRSDGTVVAWGDNSYHQCDVPSLSPGMVFTSVSTSKNLNLAVYGQVSATATAAFRNAGQNASSLRAFTQPVLGGTYTCTVDLGSTTGHDLAWLAGFETALTLTLPGGQTLLVNSADPIGELLGHAPRLGPTALFDIPVPADPLFAGYQLSTQAAHFGGASPWALSNALDLVLGW
ncbi:MAG: hypothetical protein GY711_06420 [bacterium]|nr:hypothetical protein [bacterium]